MRTWRRLTTRCDGVHLIFEPEMKRLPAASVLVLFWTFGSPSADAQSQAPSVEEANVEPETVVVTGHRIVPANTVDHFIKSYAAPTAFLGKLARWNQALCYKVSGSDRQETAIQQRVLTVAAMIGVRVDVRPACRSNVEIVFTATPQTYLDDIRKNHPEMLGLHDGSTAEAQRIATMTGPIQAWYATQIRDAVGQLQPERNYETCLQASGGLASPDSLVTPNGTISRKGLDDLNRNLSLCGTLGKSSLIANGISTEFANVLVVADTAKLPGVSLAPLADYIAMLVLSPGRSSGACQELPSITNLLASDCDPANIPDALTDVDMAYLKALYAMEPDQTLALQRGDIASRMKRALNGR